MLFDIPGYEILEELGRGGMSTVYRAIQKSLDRELALKVMSPRLSIDPHFKERFRREGRIVAQLSHPNIIAVYDMGVVGDCLFIAMEYVAAKTLKERIRGRLTLEESIGIVKVVAHALKYAHQRGYIHRDIKPSNILFREDGSPVVADFGIAKAIKGNSSLTQTGMNFGTPRYMSPEQIRGEQLDARSDLYSLGMVFYQMLTGKRPYEAGSAFSVSLKHLFEPIPKLPDHLCSLQPVLDGMLAKVPAHRFQDEDAFLSALDDAIAKNTDTAVTAFFSKPNRQATQEGARRVGNQLSYVWIKRSVVGLGVTAALVGAMTFWFSQGSPQDPGSSTPQTDGKPQRNEQPEGASGMAKLLDRDQTDRSQSEQSRFAGLAPPKEKSFREQEHAAQITTLLTQAKKQLRALKLTTPEKDNAFETLSQVLATDPSNQEALNGLGQIADRYEYLARRQLDSNNLSHALALVKSGLKVHTGHASLSNLKEEITRALEAKESREVEVNSLLAQAEQQLQAGKTTNPVGDNAYETLQRVLELDADNRQVRQVLQAIATRLEVSVRDAWKSGDLRKSLSVAQQGLRFFPEDDGLRSLAKELTRLNATVSSLLSKAKQQIRSGQLTAPPGDNALETINRALTFDPKNEFAKTSLEAIPKYCEQLARVRQQAGQVQKALSIVEEGLRFFPENDRLLALREELHEQSQEQTQPETQRRRVFGTF